ncbi:MAG TPA: tetratricopeptide repeat protein, partial [Acidimicrobiales bacterium]|nr:tetratricopeptide repeat protein [Acidimicrobiales bacterium]
CRRLDGIPLAIELAAARMRTMSVADIELRLGDRFQLLTSGPRLAPKRQQTLTALIDWSYDLLSEEEKATLRSLAVAPSSFDLAASEAFATALGAERSTIFDVVGALVDKSLLQVDASGRLARYRMSETVREYAWGKASEAERTGVREAHAKHFLAVAELAAPHFAGAALRDWRERTEPDDDNLRAALTAMVSGVGSADDALRLATALCRYWNVRGYYGGETSLIEGALARAGSSAAVRTPALVSAGYVMFRCGESGRARELLEEALELAETAGAHDLEAGSLRTLAWVADRRGEHEAASGLAERAVAAARASGDGHLIARAHDVRAASCQRVDPDQARRDYADALRYSRAVGDLLGQVTTLNNLAVLELEQGNYVQAKSHFVGALAIASELDDKALRPYLEYGVGLSTYLDGDAESARPALATALSTARATGQRTLVAYSLLASACSLGARARYEDAAHVLGCSARMFEELSEEPEDLESRLRSELEAELAAQLGASAATALDAGGRMPVDQAMGIVLRGS